MKIIVPILGIFYTCTCKKNTRSELRVFYQTS